MNAPASAEEIRELLDDVIGMLRGNLGPEVQEELRSELRGRKAALEWAKSVPTPARYITRARLIHLTLSEIAAELEVEHVLGGGFDKEDHDSTTEALDTAALAARVR